MSVFEYKLRRQSERIGEIELEIECLRDLDQTIDDLFVELERSGNARLLEELCPYFGIFWPAARALAATLSLRRGEFAGSRILELGCGLAVPGLVAAKLGAEVVVTDSHPQVPKFLERNLVLNHVSTLDYVKVDWAEGFPELGRFDWVIGSDVLYEKQHAVLLAKTAARYLKPGSGRVLIADPARPYLQSFVDEMNRLGFLHETKVQAEIFLMEFYTGCKGL